MTNYKFTSGPYRGRVTEEGATILDVPFGELTESLKGPIAEYLDSPFLEGADPDDHSADELAVAVRSFENSWDSEETEDPIDLLPLSAT